MLSVLLACASPAPPPVVSGPTHRPNVLVLLWDTARADRLSLYGSQRKTTPRLEAWAHDAAVFDTAVSAGTWTVPSHGALFTGLPVAAHGADTGWIWLDHRFVTAAEWFGQHGWDTWAFSANPYVSPATNLLQGFTTVHTTWDGRWAEASAAATRAKLLDDDASVEISPQWQPRGRASGWPEHLTAYKDAAPVAHSALAEWLDGRPDGAPPFFAFVNLLEAHHPRVPSAAARAALLDEAARNAALTADLSLFAQHAAMEGRHTWTETDRNALVDLYDASLWDLDAATGDLVDDLRARGILDDTVVVLVSDHGEHLGEHGMFEHRWSIREPVVHVPLVVRWPGHVTPGRRKDAVSTQGLLATLDALVGLADPPGVRPLTWMQPADGAAFTELWHPNPRLPFIEAAFPDLPKDRWKKRWQAARQDRWKLVHASDGSAALYDLATDPGETRDVAKQNGAVARAGLAGLAAWQRRLPRYDPALRGPDDHPQRALAIDDPLREQLDVLGYAPEDPP